MQILFCLNEVITILYSHFPISFFPIKPEIGSLREERLEQFYREKDP